MICIKFASLLLLWVGSASDPATWSATGSLAVFSATSGLPPPPGACASGHSYPMQAGLRCPGWLQHRGPAPLLDTYEASGGGIFEPDCPRLRTAGGSSLC